MEQTTTGSTSGALHAIRGTFGFLLSVLLLILLLLNGFLFPAKTTVFKGDSINEIFENLNIYKALSESLAADYEEELSNLGKSNAIYKTILTEKNIQKFCDTVITGVLEDKEMDFSFLEAAAIDTAKSEIDSTINNAFDEIAQNHKVINADTLSSNSALNAFEESYGLDISGTIMDALSSQYGVTSIDLNYIDINTVKSFVSDSIKNTVYPEVESMISETITESSSSITEEINASIDKFKLKDSILMFDTYLASFKLLVTAIFVIIAIIIIIQLIMYHSCLYRAFRNFFISSIFSGIIVAGIGYIATNTLPPAIEQFAAESDYGPALIDFITAVLIPYFKQLNTMGIIYLAAFAICLILSIIFKTVYKNKHTIHY